MAFPLPDPLTGIQNFLSPVGISVSLENPNFGTSAKVNVVATAALKLTGQPIPYLPLDLLLNGQTFKQRVTTDSNGKINQLVTLTEEGVYTFEAVPSDLETFQNAFGSFIPSGSATLMVYSLNFQARNNGLGKDMNVVVSINNQYFTTPTTILSPLLHLSATYPQVTQGVYALDSYEFEFDVRGDEAFLVHYNAPGSIIASLSFTDPIGETILGVINGTVNDIGGHPFPNVPLSVGNVQTQTDSNGGFSSNVETNSAGAQSLTVKTLTPVSITQKYQFLVYSVTFKALNSGLGQTMNVGITVGGKNFTTPATLLALPLNFNAAYPQITQGVYSLDANEFKFAVTGDEAFLVHYNAPGSIDGSLSFADPLKETIIGAINGTVLDVGGHPFPNVPLSINGVQTQIDSNGNFRSGFEVRNSGIHSFAATTLTPISVTKTFQFQTYALTFKAFNSGLNQDMNVGIAVAGKNFTTPVTVLAVPPLTLSAAYPQITQGVYSLDTNQFNFMANGDEAFLVHYNAPKSIVGGITFNANCIPSGGTVSGVINGTVNDIGGHPFPQIPISSGGNSTQTDASGNFSLNVQATSPGTQSLTVATLTPISITQTFQQNLPACLPPSPPPPPTPQGLAASLFKPPFVSGKGPNEQLDIYGGITGSNSSNWVASVIYVQVSGGTPPYAWSFRWNDGIVTRPAYGYASDNSVAATERDYIPDTAYWNGTTNSRSGVATAVDSKGITGSVSWSI